MDIRVYLLEKLDDITHEANVLEDLWDGESRDTTYVQMLRAKAQKAQLREIFDDFEEEGII